MGERTFSFRRKNQTLRSIKLFPKMHEDVSPLYGFDIPTYRILIGQSYAIFYRIDEENHSVLIGKIFKQKQMHLKF
jgi:plasmid stabilization system protein ParE